MHIPIFSYALYVSWLEFQEYALLLPMVWFTPSSSVMVLYLILPKAAKMDDDGMQSVF